MLFIIGLVFGSFIAALTYRYPKRISNFSGRSFCDNCKKQLIWHDNIPLLSYFFLNGKCRNCKSKISWRYPVIEFTTATGFYLIFTLQGYTLQGVYSIYYLATILFIYSILEIIFIIDFENQIIPDDFIFLGIAVVLLMPSAYSLMPRLLAGFTAASFLLLIHIATRGRGMGLGDVKFAVLGGMIAGPLLFPIWMLIAFLTGAAIGIILILGKKAGLKSKIAFGPFLVLSIPITLLWGQKIIDILLSP